MRGFLGDAWSFFVPKDDPIAPDGMIAAPPRPFMNPNKSSV
jgi:hypothetical protein